MEKAQNRVVLGLFSHTVSLSYGALTLYETYEHDDDGNNQQEMQESPEGVGRYQAEKPEHKKDSGDGVQHA